jgi:hypothetical protein
VADNQREDLASRLKVTEEITENEAPRPGAIHPVLAPEVYIMAERWKVTRAFAFQALVTIVCLAALMLNPPEPVQIAVGSIFAGSLALTKYLLSSAYRSSQTRAK